MSNLGILYRPRAFSEVFGNANMVAEMRAAILDNKLPSSILLTGDTGNGKTTLAYLTARAVNCEPFINGQTDDICGTCPACRADLNDYYASEKSGVDDFRALLKTLNLVPEFRKRVVIINEVQALTDRAEDLLLGALENESVSETNLIILTSNMPDKIKPTVLNRTARYSMSPLTVDDRIALASWVVGAEYDMSDAEADAWAKANISALMDNSDGSVRGLLNQLPLVYSGVSTSLSADDNTKLEVVAVEMLSALVIKNDAAQVVVLTEKAYNICKIANVSLSTFIPQVRVALHYLMRGVLGVQGNWYPSVVREALPSFSKSDNVVMNLLAASQALTAVEKAMSVSRYEMTAQLNNFYSSLLLAYNKEAV